MQKRLTLPQPAPALPLLDRAAVAQLLENEDSNEYTLVCHNRGVEEIDPSAWVALSRTTSVAPKVTGKGIAAQGSLGSGAGAGASTPPLLRSLDLSFNKLRALAPRCLTPLAENLRELKLYSNRLGYASSSVNGGNGRNSPADTLASGSALSFGSIEDGGLDGSGLGQCRNLERLELHDNGLFALPGACLSPKLKHLRLDRNRLTSLHGLSRCTSLAYLSLDGNQLRGLGADGDTNSSGGGGGSGKGGSKKSSSGGMAAAGAAAWLGGCGALAFLSAADNELERLPKRALSGPIAGSLVELVLSHNCLTNNCLPGLAPLKDGLEVLRLDDNHLTSLALLPSLNRLTELLVSNNRLTTTTPTSFARSGASSTPSAESANACLASLAVACPVLEVLDLSDNRLNFADNSTSNKGSSSNNGSSSSGNTGSNGSDDGRAAAAAKACVALFAVPLAGCAELRELSVGGNPCCGGLPARAMPSRVTSSAAAGTGGAEASMTAPAVAASGVSEWWLAVREALPQLHALDELDTGRRQVGALNLEGPPIIEDLALNGSFLTDNEGRGGSTMKGISEAKRGGSNDNDGDSSSSDDESEAKTAEPARAEAKDESNRNKGGKHRGRTIGVDDKEQQQCKGENDEEDEISAGSGGRSSAAVPKLRLAVPTGNDPKADGKDSEGSSVCSSGGGGARDATMGQPLSMRSSFSSSNGPLSARGHPGSSSRAFTPRGVNIGSANTPRGSMNSGGGPSSRPIMRPMSARTGLGSGEVHVETLETVTAVAAAFRAKMGAVKGALQENRRAAFSDANSGSSSNGSSNNSSTSESGSNRSGGTTYSRAEADAMAQPKLTTGGVRGSGSNRLGNTGGSSKKASDENDSSDDGDDSNEARLRISTGSIADIAGGVAVGFSSFQSGKSASSSGDGRGTANDVNRDLDLSTGLYEDLASCADPTDKFDFDHRASLSSSNGPHASATATADAVAGSRASAARGPTPTRAASLATSSASLLGEATKAGSGRSGSSNSSSSLSSSGSSSTRSSMTKGPRGLQQALGFASRRDGGGSSLSSGGNEQVDVAARSGHNLSSSPIRSSSGTSESSSGVSYGVFADKSPPPPPKLTKPWLLPNYGESHADRGGAKDGSFMGGAVDSSSSFSSSSLRAKPGASETPGAVDLSLDLSMLQLTSSSASALSARHGSKSGAVGGSDDDEDAVLAMPQPSPRFQTESTIAGLHKRPGPQAASLGGLGVGGSAKSTTPSAQNGPSATKNSNKGSFKGFKIPAAARAELDRGNSNSNSNARSGRSGSGSSYARALSDCTNSPPDA